MSDSRDNNLVDFNNFELKYKEINNQLLYEYLVNDKQEAYDKLMEINKDLILIVLKKTYRGDKENFNEFYNEYLSIGYIGLVYAISSFSFEKNFIKHALKRIKIEVDKEMKKSNKEDIIISLDEEFIDEKEHALQDEEFIEGIINKDLKNYKTKIVKRALNYLSEHEKRAIELRYGFDGRKRTVSEVARIMNISHKRADKILLSAKEKLTVSLQYYKKEYESKIIPVEKKKLIEKMNKVFYSLIGGHDEFFIKNKMVELLNSKQIKVVSLYYGLDGETCKDYDEIAKEMNITVDDVNTIIEHSIESLKTNNNNHRQVDERIIYRNANIYEIRNKFYSMFDPYTKQEVDEAVSQLNERRKKIITLWYGLEGEVYSAKSIYNVLNGYNGNISEDKLRAIQNIKDYLNRETVIENKKNEFYSLFKGYSKEEINMEIDKLVPTYKQVINLLYGFNGKIYSNADISKIHGIKQSIISSYHRRAIGKIKRNLSKGETFYSLFEGYSKEEVNNAVSRLDKKSRDIISLFYGLKGNSQTCEEIANLYASSRQNISSCKKRIIEKIKNNLENPELVIDSRDLFYALFDGYSKEEVNEALSTLNEDSKEIIYLLYGFNDACLSEVEIAKVYNKSLDGIEYIKDTSIIQMRRYLKHINRGIENKR